MSEEEIAIRMQFQNILNNLVKNKIAPTGTAILAAEQPMILLFEDLMYKIKKQQKELEKKDKIINSIKEYAQQEIDFATEDIEDYIDDDREGNKDIIGELKEWREHWKDIIRIMNNEKTYIDFEYKVEEE